MKLYMMTDGIQYIGDEINPSAYNTLTKSGVDLYHKLNAEAIILECHYDTVNPVRGFDKMYPSRIVFLERKAIEEIKDVIEYDDVPPNHLVDNIYLKEY